MKPANKIWLNGKVVPLQKAGFLNFHQGLNYGACVYEGIRFYDTPSGPSIFRLKEHLDRFFYSASVLNMNLNITKNDFGVAVKNLIKSTELKSGYIRPMAFYSEPKMGINIFGATLAVVIFVWPWKNNKADEERPVSMKIVETRRLHPATVDLKAKISGYYANGLLGFIEARKAGFDEPLFLDTRGFIAESAVSNFFIVKNRALYTPKLGNILAGITRDSIIKAARDMNLMVYEKNIRPDFLNQADEIFLSGTGIELRKVVRINGYFSQRPVSNPIFDSLKSRYKDLATGQIEKFKKWLSPIGKIDVPRTRP